MLTSEKRDHGVASAWRGRKLVDRDGQNLGRLKDVYVDVETDQPLFATVKEGFVSRHLTFVPLHSITVGPSELHATVTKEQVQSAPDINTHGDGLSLAGEAALYQHFGMQYTAFATKSGRRLARR